MAAKTSRPGVKVTAVMPNPASVGKSSGSDMTGALRRTMGHVILRTGGVMRSEESEADTAEGQCQEGVVHPRVPISSQSQPPVAMQPCEEPLDGPAVLPQPAAVCSSPPSAYGYPRAPVRHREGSYPALRNGFIASIGSWLAHQLARDAAKGQ